MLLLARTQALANSTKVTPAGQTNLLQSLKYSCGSCRCRVQRGDLEGKSSRLRSDYSRNQVSGFEHVSDIFKNVPHRTRGGVSRGLGHFLRVIWVISRLIDGAAKSVKQLLDRCETHRSSRVMSTPTDGVAFRVSEISVQKCFMTSFRDVQPVCM